MVVLREILCRDGEWNEWRMAVENPNSSTGRSPISQPIFQCINPVETIRRISCKKDNDIVRTAWRHAERNRNDFADKNLL